MITVGSAPTFNPAVYQAAADGNVRALQTALSAQRNMLDVPHPSRMSTTPVYIAAKNGHIEALRLLLDTSRLSIDVPNSDGCTPLWIAAFYGHEGVIEVLAEKGCKAFDTPNKAGWTPLHAAAQGENDETYIHSVALLLEKGSRSLDAKNKDNRTPLDMLELDNTRRLLEMGVDLYAKTNALLFPATIGDIMLGKFRERLSQHPHFRCFVPRSRIVDCRGRQLTNTTVGDLPFANWRSCEGIDFTNNKDLTEIPTGVGLFDPRRTRSITFDTPTARWGGYEATIAGQSAADIINYASLKANGEGLVQLGECKMMAVGHMAVGKTTLVRRLRNETFADVPSTDGVAMGDVQLSTDDDSGQRTRLVVWDFAGQPIYQQTHLLFLRNPGLCLVIFRLTEPVAEICKQLHPWCEAIFAMSSSSSNNNNNSSTSTTRLMLVGTHLDRCTSPSAAASTARQVWAQLKQNFFDNPLLDECEPLLVSCADGRDNEASVVRLRQAVARAAFALAANMRVPSCVETVRAALQAFAGQTIPLVSVEKAHEAIREHARGAGHQGLASGGEQGRDLRARSLHSLHSVGAVVLVFDASERPVHVVCNPQWVAVLLATVVTTRHSWLETGRVDMHTLSTQVWTDHAHFPPKTHSTLITILRQLKVLITLDTSRTKPSPPSSSLLSSSPEPNLHRPVAHLPDRTSPKARVPNTRFGSVPRALPNFTASSSFSDSPSPPRSSSPLFFQPPSPSLEPSSSSSLLSSIQRIGTPIPELETIPTFQDSPSTVYFVPCVLPASQPNFRFAMQAQTNSSMHWLRVFKLKQRGRSIPIDMLPRLIVDVMGSPDIHPVYVWQQGAVLHLIKTNDRMCLRKRAVDEVEFHIITGETSLASKWLRDISTMVDNQLTGVYHLDYDVRIPCSPTTEKEYCYVDLSEIQACIIAQNPVVGCSPRQNHQSRVDALAPDLFFADLGEEGLYRWHQVELLYDLGTGSFGKVMFGRLTETSGIPSAQQRDEGSPEEESAMITVRDVAVKLLQKKEGQDEDTAEKERKQLMEFQHETFLMSLLSHPNVVKFVGLCLPDATNSEPALLMEVVPGGTLYDALTDGSSLIKVAKELIAFQKKFDEWHIKSSIYHQNTTLNPEPESIAHQTTETLSRLQSLFDQRIFPLCDSDTDLRHTIDSLCSRAQQAVRAYSVHPLTKEVHAEFTELLDALQTVATDSVDRLTPLDWPMRLKLATDVVQGLMHLHDLKPPLVHRDLKSPNVFLMRPLFGSPNPTDWSKPIAKLGDFGMSIRLLGAGELKAGTGENPIDHITPTWAAPEVLSKNAYSTEADVYAVGITLWELLTRKHPFNEQQCMYGDALGLIADLVKRGQRPELPSEEELEAMAGGNTVMHDRILNFVGLIQACWQQEPRRRPPIQKVYYALRQICEAIAPELFAVLPDVSISSPATDTDDADENWLTQPQTDRYLVHRIDRVDIPLPETAARRSNDAESSSSSSSRVNKVRCLQHVDDYIFWAGLTDGRVVYLNFDGPGDILDCVPCCPLDQHEKGVGAMCFNQSQQQTVWSSDQKQIFVWRSEVATASDAGSLSHLRATSKLLNTDLPQLLTKGGLLSSPKMKDINFTELRNGRLHFYPDQRSGKPVAEFDVSACSIAESEEECVLNLIIKGSDARTGYALLQFDRAETVQQWQRVIGFLREIHRNEKALFRLAASPIRFRSQVTGLEVVGDSTWSLSESDKVELTEWTLRLAMHGLTQSYSLEPGRRIELDLSEFPSRLRFASQLVWSGSNVIWLAAANTLVSIIEQPNRQHKIVWPADKDVRGERAPNRILLLTFVNSLQSPSGKEVWTYSDGEPHLNVWQTPLLAGLSGEAVEDDCVNLKLLVQVPLMPNLSAALELTCLKQVNATQVWAGTYQGSVIGWDINTRSPLSTVPLLSGPLQFRNPVTALASPDFSSAHSFVFASGFEQVLRRLNLKVEKQP